MDPGDASKMTPTTSYPSPTAQPAVFPFYSHQNPADHDNQPHAPTAPMQGSDVDGRHFTPHYGPAQASTPQQLAQQGLDINHGGAPLDAESAKKKQKVSRACDECRRKKIKCDAAEDDPSKPRCSACARSDSLCEFSRAPQKRGPSKGYIKDLAERVHMLENRNGNSQPSNPGFSYDLNPYSPSSDLMGPDSSRKRTHSMTEGSGAFASNSDQLQNFGRGYTPNMSSDATMAEGSLAFPGGFDPLRNINSDLDSIPNITSIDDYYRELHTVFPILPDTKADLSTILDNIQNPLRDALLACVDCAMKYSTGAADPRYLENVNKMFGVLVLQDPKSRSIFENLVVMQICLFVIIAQSASGPGNAPLLPYTTAMNCGIHLGYDRPKALIARNPTELIACETHGRRTWLVLAMTDRWRAASLGGSLCIRNDQVKLLESDRQLLGEFAWNLFQLSRRLGHSIHVITRFDKYEDANGEPSDPLLNELIVELLEQFETRIETFWPQSRHLQLAAIHAQLFALCNSEPKGRNQEKIITAAFSLIRLLPTEQNHASPLTNHFAALATVTLSEVLERDPVHIGNALQDLQKNLNNGSIQCPYGISGNRPAWSNAISKYISKFDLQNQKLATASANSISNGAGTASDQQRGGLEDLAEAAVGGTSALIGDEKAVEETAAKIEAKGDVDWSAVVRNGYFKAFE